MGIPLAVGWVGYTLVYFGWCSIRGAGVGFLDLVIPGRTFEIPTGGPGTPKPKQSSPAAGGSSGYKTLPLPPGPGTRPDLVA